jgi:hypothetical protein
LEFRNKLDTGRKWVSVSNLIKQAMLQKEMTESKTTLRRCQHVYMNFSMAELTVGQHSWVADHWQFFCNQAIIN